MKIRTEPVLVRAAVGGLVAILALFGIAPPDDIVDAVAQIAVIAVPLAAGAISARGKVTPVK